MPWTGRFIKEILAPSPVGTKARKKEDITPYELYIKYLQTQIGDIANPESIDILKSFLPSHFHPLEYQLHAVQQCFYIMKQHGGFILADVVGLGKTVVGLLTVKKFISEASTLGRSEKVLIVTPPAIKASWEQTIVDFDKDRTDKISPYISFVTVGSIGNLVDNNHQNDISDTAEINDIENQVDTEAFDLSLEYDNYGLILVDESHNFRNSSSQKYRALDDLIHSIELRTGGATPYIGLLSATPQNNSPADLKNQILLFQREPNNSTLPNVPGGKLESFMNEKNKEFVKLRKEDTPEAREALKKLSAEIRDIVLNDLVVRRTRRDIKLHYQSDSETLKFPEIKGPHKLEYEMDAELCKLFSDTVNQIAEADGIGFYRYAAIKYFKDKSNEKLYEKRNLTVEKISDRLAKIMRTLLVKRLESSFTAFKISLHNLLRYTENMLKMLDADTVFVCPDIDINGMIAQYQSLEAATPHIIEKINAKGGNNRCFKKSDFDENYRNLLESDKEAIDKLCKRWDANDYDPKFDKFKESIESELFNPEINNPGEYDKPRLVIFSEAVDTVNSLVRCLTNKGHKVLKVTAANRTEVQQAITENFDANSSVRKDDYDVIVTTEVLAEGVNLHRANVILNYDTPWNATRLMQRIGRVNRIGSKEECVHVFNFFPSAEGNEQIKLIQIAYAKLQAFHTMFGEDNKVFTEMEELSETEFKHIIEDETSPLSEYICDLKDFQRANPTRYQELANKDFADWGGRISGSEDGLSLVVIGAPNRGLTNIMVENNDSSHIIAPITAMQFLKCDKSAQFASGISKLGEINEFAMTEYHTHVNKMRTSKDANNAIKKAMVFLHKQIQPKLSGDDAVKAFSYADNALRNSSYAVARQILNFAKEYEAKGASLFGEDFDLNSWVQSAFGKLAQQTKEAYGEPYIAAIEAK